MDVKEHRILCDITFQKCAVHTKLDIYVCITFRVDISTGEPHVPAGILRPVGGVLALTRCINSIYVIEI